MNRIASLWFLLVLLSLLASGYISYRGINQPTGPRKLRWFGPNKKPLFGVKHPLRVNSCQGDRYFRTLAVGRYLWTVCVQGLYTAQHHTQFLNGVYVRFDMKRKRAQAFWPLPADNMLYHTLGLLPASDGKLAIVYRARHSHGPLVVAIANAQGWWVPPTPLPAAYSGRLLGMRWSLGELKLAVTESQMMDRLGLRTPAAVLSFHPKRKRKPLRFPRSVLCQNKKPCQMELAYPGERPHEWNVMVFQKHAWQVTLRASVVSGSPPTTLPSRAAALSAKRQTTLQARHRIRKDWEPYRTWFRRRVDASATGVLPQRTQALERRFQLNGQLTWLDSLKGWDNNNLLRQSGNFFFSQGKLRHRVWWSHPPHGLIHRVNKQRIRIHFRRAHKKPKPKFFHSKTYGQKKKGPPPQKPAAMQIQRIETWRTQDLGTLSSFPPQQCASLGIGGWVQQDNQAGHWLVSPSGCYLTLNAQWRRSDPIPLLAHLKQRASNQRKPLPSFGTLAWLLLGGPLCMMFGWIWSPHLSNTSKGNTSSLLPYLLPFLVLLLFLLTALYPWMQWRTFYS